MLSPSSRFTFVEAALVAALGSFAKGGHKARPYLPNGRSPRKQKSLPIPRSGIGRLSPLSVEELGRVTVPGQVSWLSGYRLLLRLPFPQSGKVAVRQVTDCEDLARRSQWRDRGRFSRPSLFPRFVPGHHRNKSFQRTTTSRKINIWLRGCQEQSPRPQSADNRSDVRGRLAILASRKP